MIQNLKGFRDFYGRDAKIRSYVLSKLESAFKQYGFELMQTPALEYEELLLGKYGAEANKLIYSFEDRGERRIAMRYDQTVPTARAISQYREELGMPYARYAIAPVWRADKPQKGRYREFLQCDIDIYGTSSSLADATILATTASALTSLGLEFKILYNSRPDLTELIVRSKIPSELVQPVISILDKLDKKTTSDVVTELRTLGLTSDNCDTLFESIKAADPSSDLSNIIQTAIEIGAQPQVFEYAPSLARGLDYYTGLIFEVKIIGYENGSIGGGGRYSNLIENLVGYKCDAVGMAFGFDRLIDAMQDLGVVPQSILTGAVALVTTSPSTLSQSKLAFAELQKAEIPAIIYPDESRKLESQYKYATAKNIPYIVTPSTEESVLNIKNSTTREIQKVQISALKSFFTV